MNGFVRTLGEIHWEKSETENGFREVWFRACTDGFVEIRIHEYDEKEDRNEDLRIVLTSEEEVDRFVKNLRTMFYMAQNEQTEKGN